MHRASPVDPHLRRARSQPEWRGPYRHDRQPPGVAAGSDCGFGDLLAFERDALRNWLGVDPTGLSEAELAEALRPVVALGSADPRVGAFFVELSTLQLDPAAWPSLPASLTLSVALASEAIVRVDGHFAAD